jgi:hypothetical protein
MESKNKHHFSFLSNGLLFTSAILFAAFSYSEKDTIKKELNKVKSTNVKFEPRVQKKLKKPAKIKKLKIKDKQKNNTKKIDLKSKPTTKIKISKNKPDSTSTVNILPSPIDFDSTVVYKVVPVIPDIVDFPDQEAQFFGGISEMTKYIVHNLDLNRMDLFGAGELLHGKHDKSVVREVKRMIQSMPKWIPGEFEGRKVHSRMYLPIRIDMQ